MLEHGTYSVYVENSIVIGKVSGSHNEYDVKAATNSFKQAIETFKGAAFVEIIDARELDGVTPEGYAEIEKYNSWLVSNGLVARGFVVTNSALPLIFKRQTAEVQQFETKVFSDVETAKLWLQEELVKITGKGS